MNSRGLAQTQLAQRSGVNQSTISKIINHSQTPGVDNLKKLFQALGLKLGDVLNETDELGHEILGYLATPLTGVVKDKRCDAELRRVVKWIKEIASSTEFSDPLFDLYWPGDYTHPVQNPDFPSAQVYLTDRSRASTHDFLILLCAEPSYGVGQENEIATQAGIPAIRLIPDGMSRMMLGAFVKAIDLRFTGSLREGINFSPDDLRGALREIRRLYFHYRPLFRGMNGKGFGERLRKLIDTRTGGYLKFAEDLGVNLTYIHALMDEAPSVSNPSICLLKKMAIILQEDVSFLIGESDEADPIWTESKTSWHAWVTGTPGLDAAVAVTIRDDWRDQYHSQKAQPSMSSFRKPKRAMQRKTDWDALYKERQRKSNGPDKHGLFS
jgi:transcriptional regulator with XRE-family HTH domain